MNIFDNLLEALGAAIERIGIPYSAPGFIVGLVVVGLGVFLLVRSSKESGIGIRVATGICFTLGLPILMRTFGFGGVDTVLWSLIAIFLTGLWLIFAKGVVITFVGLFVTAVALVTIFSVAQSNPDNSGMAQALNILIKQAGDTVDVFRSSKFRT